MTKSELAKAFSRITAAIIVLQSSLIALAHDGNDKHETQTGTNKPDSASLGLDRITSAVLGVVSSDATMKQGDQHFLKKEYSPALSYYASFLESKLRDNQSLGYQLNHAGSAGYTSFPGLSESESVRNKRQAACKLLRADTRKYLDDLDALRGGKYEGWYAVVQCIGKMSVVFDKLGYYDDADEMYRAIMPEIGGGIGGGAVAIVNDNTGFSLYSKDSTAIFEDILKSVRSKFGADSPILATRLELLGDCYSNQNRKADAAVKFEEAINIRVNTKNPDYERLVADVRSLRACAGLNEKLLALSMKAVGKDDALTLDIMRKLRDSYSGAGKTADAERLNQEINNIVEKDTKLSPTDRLDSYRELAKTYRSLGDFNRTTELQKKVLSLSLHFRKDMTFSYASNMADKLVRMKEFGHAEDLLKSLIKEQQSSPNVDELAKSKTIDLLAGVYSAAKNFDEAEKTLNEALLVLKNSKSVEAGREESRIYGKIHYILCYKLKDYLRSEECDRRALAASEARFGSGSVENLSALFNLAHSLKREGKLSESEELSKKADVLFKKRTELRAKAEAQGAEEKAKRAEEMAKRIRQ